MKIQKKVYVFEVRGGIEINSFDMSSRDDWVVLGEINIDTEIEINDIEIRDKKINKLNEKINTIRADSENAISNLQGEIQKLLAIGSDNV